MQKSINGDDIELIVHVMRGELCIARIEWASSVDQIESGRYQDATEKEILIDAANDADMKIERLKRIVGALEGMLALVRAQEVSWRTCAVCGMFYVLRTAPPGLPSLHPQTGTAT